MRRLLPVLFFLAACGSEADSIPAASRGAELAASPALSSSGSPFMNQTRQKSTASRKSMTLPPHHDGRAAAPARE
jgi:hypothetical protein